MRSDKNLAIKLRKSGNSYSQISSVLNIPKSTLSYWLKDIIISREAKEKIQARTNSTGIAKLIDRNKNQSVLAETRHTEFRKQGKEEAKKLLSDSLFIIGLSLYWAEGYKQGAYGSKWKSIDFANSDPEMIKIMVKFFTKFLNIKKSEIKIQIMLHNSKNVDKAVNFWHNITRVPKENFIKTSFAISKASLNKQNRKLEYGTIHLRINNVESFFRLIGWIDGLKLKFI
jgi:hypothetical protein